VLLDASLVVELSPLVRELFAQSFLNSAAWT